MFLFGTVFSSPSRLAINDPEEKSSQQQAIIYGAGPIMSLVVAAVFLAMIPYGGLAATIGMLGATMNLLTATYSLLPFKPMDGLKIFKWKKKAWVGLFVPMMAMYFTLILPINEILVALSDVVMGLDVGRVLILVILISVFIGLEAVGEVIDEWKNKKRSLGHEAKSKIKPYNVKAEFDPRCGSVANGVKQAFSTYIAFVLVPTLLVVIASGITDDLNLSDPALLQLAYGRMYDCIFLFGIILFVLNFVRGLYQKGSAGRFAFGLATIPFTVLFASTVLLSTAWKGR